MTTEPVERRIERIRDRMNEISHEIAGMDEDADTETEDPGEQAELLAKVTELRDEHSVLEERLTELLRGGEIADDPGAGDAG